MNSQKKQSRYPANCGAALLLLVLLFTAGSLLVVTGMSRAIYTDAVGYTRLADTKQNILTADSGLEDVVYRLREGMDVSDTEVLALFGAITTTTTVEVSGELEVETHATTTNRTRKRKMILTEGGVGVAFNYGIQVGEGGIAMKQSASVDGNVYSNGPLVGESGFNGLITGDAVSAGPTGHIDDVMVTGSAYAHSIEDSEVGADAYYQFIDGVTQVTGTKYPDSPDQPPGTMPISDETIDQLKADAEAGGVITCESGTYEIKDVTVTLGPKKIDCDLSISNATVTLKGPVWVAGSMSISQSSQIKLSASLGDSSGVIIADEEDNRLSSSRIELGQSGTYIGRPSDGAYIVFISRNNSAESGGSVEAISISNNNPAGDLVHYAPHGQISLANSVHLVEVTAYKISAQNSAQVIYEEGVASLLFSSGPSGGYRIESWSDET